MICLFVAAFAQGPAGPTGATGEQGPASSPLTNTLIAVFSAAMAVASREGLAFAKRRSGGNKLHTLEHRVLQLEEGEEYLTSCIFKLAGHGDVDLPSRAPRINPPSGGSSEGD